MLLFPKIFFLFLLIYNNAHAHAHAHADIDPKLIDLDKNQANYIFEHVDKTGIASASIKYNDNGITENIESVEKIQNFNVSISSDEFIQYLRSITDAKDSSSSTWIAIISLIISVFTFLYNHHENKIKYDRSIKDDYWFRTILVPIILEPLIKFANKHATNLDTLKTKLNNTTDDIYKNFLNEFQNDRMIINDRCILLQVYSNSLDSKIVEMLDDLEDEIAKYCYNQSILKANNTNDELQSNGGEIIFKHLGKIIQEIKCQHKKLIDG